MSHAGWDEILKLALSQFAAQPIELRIFAGLAIAFAALMIVEGLRVSFVTGHRSRLAALERLIDHMVAAPGVWFATLEQIAGIARAQLTRASAV